jgi:hypothetical protein
MIEFTSQHVIYSSKEYRSVREAHVSNDQDHQSFVKE